MDKAAMDNAYKDLIKLINGGASDDTIINIMKTRHGIDDVNSFIKQYKQTSEEGSEDYTVDNESPINDVEDNSNSTRNQLEKEQASIDAKNYAKEYLDNYEKEIEEGKKELEGDGRASSAHEAATAASQLTSSAPLFYKYFLEHPGEAAKIVEKAKDINTLSQAKALNFLDNMGGRLLRGMDKGNSSFKSSVIGTDKINPFQWGNKSSEVKDVVRAIGKTNSDNPGILNKSVGTVTKNSNAYSNLSTAQKITGALQIIGMATAALDGSFGTLDDIKTGTIKQSDNVLVNKIYNFCDYIDRAATDIIPGLGLVNAGVNIYYGNDKDENGLAKARGGLLTKLGLDFWTEKDENKRDENKEVYKWMEDRGYTEGIGRVKTVKGSVADNEKKQVKAIDEMNKMKGEDKEGFGASAAATNYIVQMNEASGNKMINAGNGIDMTTLTKADIYDKYKWKKQKDGSYDWINKKTGTSLSSDIKGVSKSTGKTFKEIKAIKNEKPEGETINI